MPEIVGKCKCPICKAEDADVKRGANGKHFINCDSCVSLLRTMSREGSDCIARMMTTPASGGAGGASTGKPGDPVPVQPANKAAPVDVPAAVVKKKRGVLAEAMHALGGGDD